MKRAVAWLFFFCFLGLLVIGLPANPDLKIACVPVLILVVGFVAVGGARLEHARVARLHLRYKLRRHV